MMKKNMTDPSLIVAITGLMISLGGVVGALLNSLFSAKKSQLETIQAAISSVERDNERLRVRLDEAEEDNEKLRAEIKELKSKVDMYECERRNNLLRIEQLESQVKALEAQLEAASLTPVTKGKHDG
jgi:chromosome segregation ATPase